MIRPLLLSVLLLALAGCVQPIAGFSNVPPGDDVEVSGDPGGDADLVDTSAPSHDSFVGRNDAGPVSATDVPAPERDTRPDAATDDAGPTIEPRDQDDDGWLDNEDCAPLDAHSHPGASETCDDVDNDCNGVIDDDPVADCNALGVCADYVGTACVDGEAVCVQGDVDGFCPYELCDGLDNDCDGSVDETQPYCCDCDEAEPPPWVFVCDPKAADPDDDDDGVPDEIDVCPDHVDPLQADTDGDGIGDVCDSDDDNDGSEDVVDCAPYDPTVHPLAAEKCNGKDDDCNDQIDEGLGILACGEGPCATTVPACVNAQIQVCVPLPVPEGTCDAEPAACKQTTSGTDACGMPCTKVGPPACYVVHPACIGSNPGSYTDLATCTTPVGDWDCGLSCEPWPNSLGADCERCWKLHCEEKSGPDEAQFGCDNPPALPTP